MLQVRSLESARHRVSQVAAAALLLCACDDAANNQAVVTPPGVAAAPSGGPAGAPANPPMGSTASPAQPSAPPAAVPPAAQAAGGGAPAAPGIANPPAANPNPPTAAAAAPSGGPSRLTVSLTVPNVAPGVEGTRCLQVQLPNAAPVNVTKVHNTLSLGSHHFIVTALTDAAATEKPLADCKPFRGAIAGAPLTITQKHDDEVLLPQGIGYRLTARQVLHLELHYINTGDKPLDIVATANLFPAEASAQLQEAAVLLMGTTDINVPPHTSQKNTPKYLALPAGMEGVQFYAITGHTHRSGTSVRVTSAARANAPGAVLYEPEHFDWEAPEMKMLDPVAMIPAGGGFTVQCGWTNNTDETLSWGESATREMCFFWGYYYPRKPVVSIVIDNLDPELIKRL